MLIFAAISRERVEIMSETNKELSSYTFPKWSNKVPAIVLFVLISLISFIVFVFWYWFSPKNLNVGYEPEQPIHYSHRLHAGELGIDCRYCHTQVDSGAHSNIPATQTCMNCHSVIQKDSPEILKLRESYANNEPVEWEKVHQLPDYVYFNHSRHVNSGVSCVSCHGRVDQMEVVRQEKPLSMSWCLDCHRDPAPNLRPKDKVTDLSWEPNGDPEMLGRKLQEHYKIYPKDTCSTCHF